MTPEALAIYTGKVPQGASPTPPKHSMTPEELERLAREAGTDAATAEAAMRVGFATIQRGRLLFINDKMGEMLVRFAALVRAQALEQAAQAIDSVTRYSINEMDPYFPDADAGGVYCTHDDCADAIRALKEQP